MFHGAGCPSGLTFHGKYTVLSTAIYGAGILGHQYLLWLSLTIWRFLKL